MKAVSMFLGALCALCAFGAQAGQVVVDPIYVDGTFIRVFTEHHGAAEFSPRAIGRVVDRRTIREVTVPRDCLFARWRNCGTRKVSLEDGFWIDRINETECSVHERTFDQASPWTVTEHSWTVGCSMPSSSLRRVGGTAETGRFAPAVADAKPRGKGSPYEPVPR